MAGYRGHLATSTALGIAYGAGAVFYFSMDWMYGLLAAGLTAASGMLPDLDSDSGVPVRSLFAGAGILVPLMMLPRLLAMHYPLEGILLALVVGYVVIRYCLSVLFKRMTVHRGMFHSVPAMLIAGLGVFLVYHHPDANVRMFLAGGTMVGFLSHLVLDELCSVDLAGLKPRLNKFSGSALKLASPSWGATLATYVLLVCLAYRVALELQTTSAPRATQSRTLSIWR